VEEGVVVGEGGEDGVSVEEFGGCGGGHRSSVVRSFGGFVDVPIATKWEEMSRRRNTQGCFSLRGL